jgi:hypothetical protein
VLFSFASRGRAQHRSRGRVCYGELPVTFTADTVVRRGAKRMSVDVCKNRVRLPSGRWARIGPAHGRLLRPDYRNTLK